MAKAFRISANHEQFADNDKIQVKKFQIRIYNFTKNEMRHNLFFLLQQIDSIIYNIILIRCNNIILIKDSSNKEKLYFSQSAINYRIF